MNRTVFFEAALCCALALSLAACGSKVKADAAAEAPPPANVERASDGSLIKVDHPEQFPLATAVERSSAPEMNATGVVAADVSRTIPVISLASGRIVEIDARLGDTVKKGQLLLKVQSADIAQAFADYQHAIADEDLARAQLARSQLLYDKGAIAQKDLEVAKSTADKARVTVATAAEHLRVLGADKDHPSPIVEIHAPVSGVITEQNAVSSGGVKTLDNSPNLFTISDLSRVWVICDVYENSLAAVRLGETADIRLNAYPGRPLTGRVSDIGSVMDPALRTAKVRIEVANPGLMRLGMFVTATFHGQQKEMHAVLPASAVLHLHDRDWVYTPQGSGRFQRVEVTGGKMLPGNLQEILAGVSPGQQVVSNALVLQNSVEQ
jgi:cobalt-zinc-cadmium efflux system membrane fusion protein